MRIWYWVILFAAASLEVGGDALIRIGVDKTKWLVVGGCLLLVIYGVAVNAAGGANALKEILPIDLPKIVGRKMDFNELLGVYVAIFALVNLACFWIRKGERPDGYTLCGLLVIIAGGLFVQYGREILG
jgi:drug/metabolite transporter (DMT)-like permease